MVFGGCKFFIVKLLVFGYVGFVLIGVYGNCLSW